MARQTRPKTRPRWMAPTILWVFVAATLLSMAGCEEDFEPPSKINSLRVLGVQADNPYPPPGSTVKLDMLWHDGASPVDSPRPVQILWLGGCFNPPGDLFYACYAAIAENLANAAEDPSMIDQFLGLGDTFSLQIPPDLLTSRPTIQGVEPYGLTYVFFAACAGEIRLAEPGDDGIPFGCFDQQGKRLGQEDFVPGYLSLYSFATRTNANPIIEALLINGKAVDPTTVPTFPRCQKGACPDLSVRAKVDPASAESNTGLYDAKGREMSEQMWVSYLATGGNVKSGSRLVNDATKGFNEDNGTDYTPPSEPGKQVIFAVVRDNRGGVSWVKQTVMFE